MRAKFATVAGLRTRYLHAGSGRPLILLHGVGMSADCFVRNIGPLSETFSVYAPDLLGHGFTEAGSYAGVAPQLAMARHITSFAETLGLESYAILGSSFGAQVGALAYFERPQAVARLVLVGSGSVFHSGEEQIKTLRSAAGNALQAMGDPTLESCRRRAENIVHDPRTVPIELIWTQLTSYAQPDRLPAYRATIEGSIAAMDDPAARVLGRLEKIACPALVIVGREDIRADWRLHEAGARRMPDASLKVYERCGHMPFLEHAERFNDDVRQFIVQ